jgi:predicted DNA-binding transcriptional regulator AlpA
MTKRIERKLEAKKLTDIPEEVRGHIRTLDALAKVAHRIMQTMLAFELQIRLSINELESQPQLVDRIGLHTNKELLTLKEAARRIGVPSHVLQENREGGFPAPASIRGRTRMYRRAEVEQWLLDGT